MSFAIKFDGYFVVVSAAETIWQDKHGKTHRLNGPATSTFKSMAYSTLTSDTDLITNDIVYFSYEQWFINGVYVSHEYTTFQL